MEEVCGRSLKGTDIVVVIADITTMDVDAIVNPANTLMIMGGGVAGAIKRVGGTEIEDEARRHAPVPIGSAIATGAGKLKAKYVIHSPTVERPGMRTTPENVRLATRAALNKARELGLATIALPGMGTGVGGLSYSEASKIMVDEIVKHVSEGTTLRIIYLVSLGKDLAEEFCKALSEVTS